MKAKAAKRYTVLTKNTYSQTVIKRHEKAAMDEFIDNIQILLSALNYRILNPLIQKKQMSLIMMEKFCTLMQKSIMVKDI